MRITDAALREVVDYLREKLPHEACGVITGRNNIASRVVTIPNVHRRAREFWAFDPDTWFATVEEVENIGEEILCVFHSHVTAGPELSGTDIRNTMYVQGEVPWLVAGFAGKEVDVATWKVEAGEVLPVDMEIIPVETKAEDIREGAALVVDEEAAAIAQS